MKCIMCGKQSGTSMYCSELCQDRWYQGRSEPRIKILKENLFRVRATLELMYDQKLYAEANPLAELELKLQTRIEKLVGEKDLIDTLIGYYNDAKEIEEEADFRCI